MAGFRSVLRSPEAGIGAGLATAVAVYLIYNAALPSHADMRMGEAHDNNIEAARKGAAWKSAGLIGIVFLLTRDVNAFIVSGAALTGIDYVSKHHNGINPDTGKLEGNQDTMAGATVHSLPSYSESYG